MLTSHTFASFCRYISCRKCTDACVYTFTFYTRLNCCLIALTMNKRNFDLVKKISRLIRSRKTVCVLAIFSLGGEYFANRDLCYRSPTIDSFRGASGLSRIVFVDAIRRTTMLSHGPRIIFRPAPMILLGWFAFSSQRSFLPTFFQQRGEAGFAKQLPPFHLAGSNI